jgi:hypothetical protein
MQHFSGFSTKLSAFAKKAKAKAALSFNSSAGNADDAKDNSDSAKKMRRAKQKWNAACDARDAELAELSTVQDQLRVQQKQMIFMRQRNTIHVEQTDALSSERVKLVDALRARIAADDVVRGDYAAVASQISLLEGMQLFSLADDDATNNGGNDDDADTETETAAEVPSTAAVAAADDEISAELATARRDLIAKEAAVQQCDAATADAQKALDKLMQRLMELDDGGAPFKTSEIGHVRTAHDALVARETDVRSARLCHAISVYLVCCFVAVEVRSATPCHAISSCA